MSKATVHNECVNRLRDNNYLTNRERNEFAANAKKLYADLEKENQELKKIKEKAIKNMCIAKDKMTFYSNMNIEDMYAYFNGAYIALKEVLGLKTCNCGRLTTNEDGICDGCKNQDGFRGNDEVYA